jgi:hypothetical protein
MSENGYINATKMCGKYGDGKRFDHWLENKSSKVLVDECKNNLPPGIPASKNNIIIKVNAGGGKNVIISGT